MNSTTEISFANGSSQLRVVFAGTPEFARIALEQLNNNEISQHRVIGVLTQPDRPAGRGLKLQASTVKSYSVEQDIPVIQPRSLRLDGKYAQDAQAALDQLKIWQPDVIVVAAYGLILPQWALDAAPLGCLNIHASLLPRWRGAAPIHRAIEAGDAVTGICIMQMDSGLDTGSILAKKSCPILPNDTTDTLHDRLAHLGAQLLLTTLDQLKLIKAVAQPVEGVSYAHKIEKIETWIDWSKSAQFIARKLRAFSSLPGLQTHLDGEVFKIWEAQVLKPDPPVQTEQECFGKIVKIHSSGIDVLCGEDVLRITQVQRAGGKRMPLESFILGSSLKTGECFASDPPASPSSPSSSSPI